MQCEINIFTLMIFDGESYSTSMSLMRRQKLCVYNSWNKSVMFTYRYLCTWSKVHMTSHTSPHLHVFIYLQLQMWIHFDIQMMSCVCEIHHWFIASQLSCRKWQNLRFCYEHSCYYVDTGEGSMGNHHSKHLLIWPLDNLWSQGQQYSIIHYELSSCCDWCVCTYICLFQELLKVFVQNAGNDYETRPFSTLVSVWFIIFPNSVKPKQNIKFKYQKYMLWYFSK